MALASRKGQLLAATYRGMESQGLVRIIQALTAAASVTSISGYNYELAAIYIAPKAGTKYHTSQTCNGLRSAQGVRRLEPYLVAQGSGCSH